MSEEIKRTITIEDDASGVLNNIGTAADDASKGLDKVGVSVSSFKKHATEFTNNLDDITEGMDQIVPGTKNLTEGVTKIGKAFKALIMNPIGLTIAAIATAFGILVKAIQNNEGAMEALKKAFKAFQPVMDLFSKAIEGIAKGIAFVVEGVGNLITKLFGLKSAAAGSTEEVNNLNVALETNKKITDDTYSAYDNSYKKLSQFINGLDNAVKKNKLADFLKGNLSNIEELSKKSDTFKEIIENMSVSNVSKSVQELRDNVKYIAADFESAGRETSIYANEAAAALDGLKKIGGVQLYDPAKAEAEFNEIKDKYDELKDLLSVPPSEGGASLEDFKNKEKELLSVKAEIDKEVKESVDALKSAFEEGAAAAGVTSAKISDYWDKAYKNFESGTGNIRFELSKLKRTLTDDLNEIFKNNVEISTDIDLNVDTEGVIKKVEGVIASLTSTKLPSIEVPVVDTAIDIEDIDLSGIEDKFEALDEIPSEVLDNISAKAESLKNALYDSLGWRLDAAREDSLQYYDILKEVEDTNWAFEQARLEAENATDEQIEEARKAHNARLKKLNQQALASVLNGVQASTSAISDTLNNLIEAEEAGSANEKEAFERTKGLQKASAIVNMLSGVAAAISTAQQLGPIVGPIIGAANAASVIAVCMAQIKKINSTKFDGAGGGDAAGTYVPAASATANTYNPTYTANTTGKNNVDRLQSTIEDNSMKNVKVYVTEGDISDSLNSKKVKVEESAF